MTISSYTGRSLVTHLLIQWPFRYAMRQHGFARNSTWSIVGSENVAGSPSVIFELKDNDYTRGIWDHGFLATYKVCATPTHDYVWQGILFVSPTFESAISTFNFLTRLTHFVLQVSLEPTQLSTKLVVKNTDSKPFSFTTALHTYFRVSIYVHIIGSSIFFYRNDVCFSWRQELGKVVMDGTFVLHNFLLSCMCGRIARFFATIKWLRKDYGSKISNVP